MSTVPCLEPGCHESVELPEESPTALATPEYLPPRERQVEITCPRGHCNLYPVPGAQ